MKRFAVVVAVAGALVASAVVAFGAPAPFHLTVAPAFALLTTDQDAVAFTVVNSNAEPVTLAVTTTDGWVVPAEKSVTLAGHTSHDVQAAVVIPTGADAGDHETRVLFTLLAPDTGTVRISWAVASRVIIATGGTVVRGLHVFGLTAPRIADSWDVPPVSLTLDNKNGNVHEVVNVAPFGQALVLRGQTRVLTVPWSRHPMVGVGTVNAGGESVSTLFLPWKLLGGVAWFLVVFVVVLRWQRRRRATRSD